MNSVKMSNFIGADVIDEMAKIIVILVLIMMKMMMV